MLVTPPPDNTAASSPSWGWYPLQAHRTRSPREKPCTATAKTAAAAMLAPIAALIGALNRGSTNITTAGSRTVQLIAKWSVSADNTPLSRPVMG